MPMIREAMPSAVAPSYRVDGDDSVRSKVVAHASLDYAEQKQYR